MIQIKLEHLKLSFCTEVKDIGVQMHRHDQEQNQWIRCSLKNRRKTKLWSNNLWRHKQRKRTQGSRYIVEAKVKPSTKVQALIEAQLRAMEIKMCELNAATKRRHTIMDRVTFLKKGIHILDPKQFMWIQTKLNMIGMLKGWKIGRISMKKKTRLIKQGLFLCF